MDLKLALSDGCGKPLDRQYSWLSFKRFSISRNHTPLFLKKIVIVVVLLVCAKCGQALCQVVGNLVDSLLSTVFSIGLSRACPHGDFSKA